MRWYYAPPIPHFTFIGYAASLKSNAESRSLECVPFPVELKTSDQTVSNGPVLTAARFNLQGVTGALPDEVDKTVVQCAMCHSSSTQTVTCDINLSTL